MTKRVVMTLGLLSLAACDRLRPGEQAVNTDSLSLAPTGISVTAAQFHSLAWLEGRWRGEMPDGKPFFEGYRMLDDSTMRTYGYADSAGAVVQDSGAIELRGGAIYTGSDGSRYVVTELTDHQVRFAPQVKARNEFTWHRESQDAWRATLRLPAHEGRPAREVVYAMKRLAP